MADGTSSLAKGLALLTVLGSDEAVAGGGLTVMRIVALTGREKSQVSRVLRVLADTGFVERDPDTLKYSLSWELFALAARAGDQRLLTAAPPLLAELVARLGETAHLSVSRGPGVLTLLSEQPPHSIRAAGWTGRRVPAHCTASGRALLLDADLAALEALFGGGELERAARNSPRTAAELHERIVASRARGWAIVDEEFEPGLIAVAAPVRGMRGHIVAAVNVSAPRFRFATRVEDAGPVIKRVADALSARLGAPVAPLAGISATPRSS
ncbi:MAG TPA: IclR family transcriptional regulator [Solirubrobacteraceae bacterium]|nr:IclR family transcriptional regulator [Solirubrobacteraceae bacterium]